MSKYKAFVTVHWEASGEIEIEADDEEHARQLAEDYHDGIDRFYTEEVETFVDWVKCLDEEPDEDSDELGYVPKEQIALPGCESLVAAVVRR